MKLRLTINSGTLAGRQFDLESGFLTIGRAESCSVRLDPMTERIASKQHAFIEAKADGYYIRDNQSTNGTFVNNERVSAVKLKSGDKIEFGANGVTAYVYLDPQPVAQALDDFRRYQVEQFNQMAAHEPASVQASLQSFGLGSMSAVKPEPEDNRARKFLLTAFALSVVGILLLFVIGLISSAISQHIANDPNVGITPDGLKTALFASLIAFTPVVIYLIPMVWLDRYDPEPVWLLALSYAWGGLIAIIVSFYVNTGISRAVYDMTQDPSTTVAIGAIVSAPIFEEASKGVGLLLLLVFFRKYFDDILDGIVYAGVIALGFATVENVLYYGRGIADAIERFGVTSTAAKSFMVLLALRGIFSPFAHATFTSMTGVGCGIARESHNGFVKILMPMIGYAAAVALHAIWNGMATLGGLDGFVEGYIVLEVPFFLIFVGFALYIMRRQQKILNEMLALDIARGLIPPSTRRSRPRPFAAPRGSSEASSTAGSAPAAGMSAPSASLASATGTSSGRPPHKVTPAAFSRIRSCAMRS
jgi:RsiW-degrading membrane proteinase PrsW (M82 family)